MADDISEAGPAGVITVTAPTDGEIRKIVVGEGEELNLDFPLTDATIELVDVDLVLTWPDGSRLILVSYGITMLMEDAAPMRVQREVVESEDLLARIGDFVASDMPARSDFSSRPLEIPDESEGEAEEAQTSGEGEDTAPAERETIVEVVEIEVAATPQIQIVEEDAAEAEGAFDRPPSPAVPAAPQPRPEPASSASSSSSAAPVTEGEPVLPNTPPTLSVRTLGPIEENSAPGIVAAEFTGADADVGDVLTYTLTGDPAFAISGNRIVVAPGAVLDYESVTSHTVTLTVDDGNGNGGTASEIVTIALENVNEFAPELTVTTDAVDENSPGGTVVATLAATDGDADETLTYTLSGADADLFEVSGDEVVVREGAELDFEEGATRRFDVTVTDSGGLTDRQAVTITLRDVNEAPSLSVPDPDVLPENSAAGTVLSFDAVDPDAGDTPSVSIGGPDAALFRVVGDTLVVAPGAVIDYETARTLSITLTATDADGLSSPGIDVTIPVGDVNDVTPVLTVEVSRNVEENSRGGTVVADLSVVDPDENDSHTYRIGGPDADAFEVVGTQIVVRSGATLDFEDQPTLNLTVTAVDAAGNDTTETVRISLRDVAEAPELTITDTPAVPENSRAGTVVATFEAVDQDAGDELTYTLSGPDAASFEVTDQNTVVVRAGADLDFEEGATRSFVLKVTDSAGLSDERGVTVTLTDVNDVTPTLSIDSQNGVPENSAGGTPVATFSATDPDTDDVLRFTLGGPDASLFAIEGGSIVVAPGAAIDYEAGATRSITLTVTDAAGQSSSESLTVAVADVNDVTPTLSIDVQNAVAENSAPGTEVATFSASDPDTNEVLKFTLSGPDASLFAVEGGSIVVAPGAVIDYEAGSTRSVTLRVTDAAGNTDSETLTVTVLDVNDVTPILTIDTQNGVPENSAPGTEVATFSTVDPDTNEVLRYTLSGPDASLFAVEGGSIIVAPGAVIDYEAGVTRSVTLRVTDAAGHTDSQTLTVVVTDVNDVAPTLSIDGQNVIAENSAAGTEVARFSATDPDADDVLTFGLSGPDAALFAIEDGRIVVAPDAVIDYEAGSTRTVTLRVTDAAGQSSSETLTIAITDVNDVTPTLSIDSIGPVTENAAPGTLVAEFSATDPDTNETLTYALGGRDASLFAIENGRIVVAPGAAIDYEDGATRSITLRVTDAAGNTDSETLTVTILDVNDVTPVLTIDTQNAVAENSAPGTEVATFSTVDPDTNEVLRYTLSGPDAALFAIDGGTIVVAPGAVIDYEAAPTRSVTLRVTDAAGNTDSETLTITVLDVNDVTPTLSIDGQNAIAENSTAGTEVARFSATDPDTGDVLSYALGGPDAALFAIENGRIVVAAGAEIDYEAGSTRTVTLRVTDAAGQSSSETLTIGITDVNDVTPTLTVTQFGAIAENSATGTVVASFSATDPDRNESLSYALAGPNANLFAIDAGRIVVAPGASLDYEAGETRAVTLVVTDAAGNSAQEALTVVLADVNDVTPTMTVESLGPVNENSPGGTAVARFSTVDPDTGDVFAYSLSGPDAGLFEVVNDTVVLRDGAILDFEDATSHRFTLTVTDAAGHTDAGDVTVVVADVNEAPTLTIVNTTPVAEDSGAGTVVATLSTTDPDAGDTIVYTLTGPDAGLFEVSGAQVVLRAGASLDYEAGPDRRFTVNATDGGGLVATGDVTVLVTDVNDVAPVLTITPLGPIAEDSGAGTVLARFTTTDPDTNDSHTHAVSGRDAALVEVVGGEVRLAAGATLDFEDSASIEFTLTVTDAAGNTGSDPVRIDVADVNEAPVLSIDSQSPVPENSNPGTVVAEFSASDADAGDTLSFSIGGRDAALFTLDGGRIVVAAGAVIDYESVQTLSIDLTVSDGDGLSDTRTLTIDVTDLNDVTPTLTVTTPGPVAENSPSGTVVASFSATDPDTNETLTYSLAGPDAALFAIDGGTIIVAPGAVIDYEAGTTRSVVLRVTDAAGHVDSETLTIVVTDVNDVTPTLSIDSQNAVVENAPGGTLVAEFSATDPDTNETLTYALSGPDAALFVIDGGTVVVAPGAVIDYEAGTTRSVTLRVTDAAGHVDSETLTIVVTDVNDVTPTLSIDSQNAVAENAPGGTLVAEFSATDPDTNETLTYILSGPDAALFAIDGGTIVVAPGAVIDYEAGTTRSITLRVTDAAGHVDSETLTIVVTDVNDVTPTLSIDSQNAVVENAPGGTLIAEFSATDPDTNETLTYALSGPDAALFAIDGGTIVVAPGAVIDYEAGTTRSVTLRVTDAAGHVDTETLTIVVTDVNDVTPTLSIDTLVPVTENAGGGTLVAEFSATDPDTNETLTYSLSGPNAALFAIDGGTIVVAPGAVIDYEAGTTRSVTLRVTDAAGHTDTETLTVAVTDVNDVAPTLSIDVQNAVTENAAPGTLVAEFSATDPDTDDSLTYALGGRDASLFAIEDGRIVVAAGAEIDHEDGATRSVTLRVTDAAGHTDSETLTVQLVNINEHDPVVTVTDLTPIDENAGGGTVVASYAATDADADSSVTVVLGGPDAAAFTLSGGRILVAAGADLDFEDGATRTVTLTATDDGGRVSVETVTVTLVDLNDETPTLAVVPVSPVSEALPAGGVVATYTVADADAGDTLTVTLDGRDAALFRVAGGEVTLAPGRSLDYEAATTVEFTITVTDGAGHATTEAVSVTLTNEDEFAPVLSVADGSPIAENSAAGTAIATYSATDADADETLTYALSGAGATYFELDDGTVRLKSGVPFDFETTPTIETTLTVTSFGGQTDTITFDVTLSNVNEGPVLSVANQRTVDENSAAGTAVADLSATDPDAGDTLTYTLSGPDAGLFVVSGGQLRVATGADLNFEDGPTRTVTVTVTDAAGLSDSATLTVDLADLNDETPDLTVVNRSPVPENSPAGTVAASFSATDADAGDVLTYALSGPDAGRFAISGGDIVFRAGSEPDFEDRNSLTVTLTVTDQGGNTSSETIAVAIGDVNEAPDLTVTGVTAIAENSAGGTVVGSFAVADPDSGEVFTYALTGPDAALFEVSGGDVVVRAGAGLNFEDGATRTLNVRVTDSGGLTDTKPLTVTLTDVNETPDLQLVGQTAIAENSPGGTFVATVRHNDPDAGDTVTYALSGADAALFQVVDGELVVKAGAALDYEVGDTRTLTITATDAAGLTDTLDVTVSLTDVNDVTPVLSVTNLSPVDENGPSGTPVASFTVDDADTNNAFTYTLTGPDAAFFAVSNGDIVVAPGRTLDFEESAVRSVTLTVDDGAGNTDTATLSITVRDINDAPELTVVSETPIEENSAAGAVVATFDVSDQDAGDAVTMSLGGPFATNYEIVGNTVVVAAGANIDYEQQTSHPVTLIATDAAGVATTRPLTVVIRPVSEFDPTLSVTSVGSLPENSPEDTVVADFVVTDADAGETFTYALTGLDAALFRVEGTQVVVAPGAVLDYESGDTLHATLTVTDAGGRAASQDFTLTLIDVPENPELTVTNEGPVDENVVAGTLIATFSTVDPDPDAVVTHTLQGTHAALFEIVGNEVRLRAGQNLNFESGATRTFEIRALNDSGFEDVEEVTIVLNDVDEAPVLGVVNLGPVDENVPGGTAIARFTVTDEDTGSSFTATLGGPDAALFGLAGDEIRLRTGSELDYEQGATRSITLTITDDDGLSVTESIVLTINPVNEFDPVITVSMRPPIDENSAAGTVVATFDAADQDDADPLTVTLAGPDATLFAISGNAVVVAPGAALDYEAGATRSVTIRAEDSGGNVTEEVLTISLANVNEFDPVLTVALTGPVDETAPSGTVVATVSVSDGDADDAITYTLSGANADLFAVTGGALVIADGAQLDFEDDANLDVTVTATDSFGASDAVSVVIAVADVNEAPTVLVTNLGPIDENVPAGTVVATLDSTDPDDGDVVSYTLFGPDAGLFEISGTDIVLRTGVTLDHEAGATRQFTVRGTDLGGRSDQTTVTLVVDDINDAPVLEVAEANAIDENTTGSPVVTTFTATDQDGDPLTVTLAGADAGIFEIVGDAVRVRAGVTLDYETQSSYEFTVLAEDGRGGTDAEAIVFGLGAVSEFDPELTRLEIDGIDHEAPAGTLVRQYAISDGDDGEVFAFTITGEDADMLTAVYDGSSVSVVVAAGYETDWYDDPTVDYTLTIDDGTRTDSVDDTVRVVSPIDTPPEFVRITPYEVYENVGNFTPLLTVYAEDNDRETTLRYSVSGRDADKLRFIGRRTLAIADGYVLDYETTPDLQFTVIVTDLSGQTDTRAIRLPVINVAGNQIGTNGDDLLHGTSEEDTLRGQGGDDVLVGGPGANTLDGGTGDDLLVAGAGDELLLGGAGIDTVDYGDALFGVTVDLGAGEASGGAGDDILIGIENVGGSAHDDTLTGDDGDNLLRGRGGNDTLSGGAGDDILIGDGLATTVIARQDFEDGDASDWTGGTTETGGGAFSTILGRFAGSNGAESVSRTFAMDPDRAYAVFEFDMLEIDSWDREDATIFLNGQAIVTAEWQASSADERYAGSTQVNGMTVHYEIVPGAVTQTDFQGWQDQRHSVRLVVSDPEASLTLGFGTTLNGGIGDESFGIDNLTVLSTDDVNGTAAEAAGDDILIGGAGDDTLDGGDGTDVAVFSGNWSEYAITAEGGGYRVTDGVAGRDGSDRLDGIEVLRFADRDVAPGSGGNGAPTSLTFSGARVVGEYVADGGTIGAASDPTGTVVATATLVDPDGAFDTATYTLGDTLGGRFAIDAATGEITVADGTSIDFETAGGSYALTVTGTDGSGNAITGSVAVSVTDFEGTFTGDANHEAVTGTSEEDTLAGGAGNDILAGGGGDDAIDGGDGTGDIAVFTGDRADYTVADLGSGVYRVTDLVAGRDGIDTVGGVELLRFADGDVLPQNRAPTGIDFSGARSVDEYVADGGTIGTAIDPTGTVVATAALADPDGAFDSATYALDDTLGGRFAIDAATGEITVADGTLIDFETAGGSYDLTVTGTDGGGNAITATVTVAVTDFAGSFTGDGTDEAITGTSEEDTLSGGAGDDVLTGGAGDDAIDGGRATTSPSSPATGPTTRSWRRARDTA